MSAVLENIQPTHLEAPSAQADLWDSRYENEGHIWGDEPSPSAEKLLERITKTSASILEIGFGYGRDTKEFCFAGHHVTGFDVSEVGLREAKNGLRSYFDTGKAHFNCGDFSSAHLPVGDFDAVYSHRTLHLLGTNGLVRAFARSAARVVKPGIGILVVSARDTRDFDPEQMIKRPDGFAEYKAEVPGRKGQLISFWDEARFRSVFGSKFEFLNFEQSEELESEKNPDKTAKFTIMVAVRKPII